MYYPVHFKYNDIINKKIIKLVNAKEEKELSANSFMMMLLWKG